MSSPTELYLPPSFPYPIKVISIDTPSSTSIGRGTRLLSYSFVHLVERTPPETRFGTWDSTVEGTIETWNVKVGDVISARRAKDNCALLVNEPCTHGIQVGGLCGLCGKDMTDYDYTGFSDASRASIQMTHSAFGPTVSLEEARKIEKETAEHMFKSRKLSLIVDLDQTIVHATVDPTVGEWIAEGEAWEARQTAKAATQPVETSGSDDNLSSDDDECNPNWEALKDVKKFKLGPESFGAPPRSSPKAKGKNKLLENEGCMYYIKPRPGWKEFLQEMATKYEMHVYTMGTRAYAEEVCSAIDPDGKIFGGRLLSRDESGSLTQKSLQRLFPCDTSMVVIIDDRADVWEWSPNLIKVIPYDFFVGIGDINSSFLPKVEPLTVTGPPKPSIKPPNETQEESSHALRPDIPHTTPEEAARAELEAKAMLTQNSLALEAQMEQRPLAKKQEELAATATKPHESHTTAHDPSTSQAQEEGPASTEKPEKPVRKALLKNDDCELERVSKLLDEVHRRFFRAYDNRLQRDKKRKLSISNRGDLAKVPYDVTRIIPDIRSEVLKGVHILFSSVIPLDTRPETTEIWKMAHMFGAKCYTELSSEITHVVAAKRGTVKVDMARRRGGIKIVWVPWFTDSVALWRHQDETPYLLDDPPVTGPSSSPNMDPIDISSDPEPDADDWDQERVESKGPQLELDAIDWNDINDEVEAAMKESDDEDDARSDGGGGPRSGNVSEDDWADESGSAISSANGTPKLKRKRLRSVTPSEVGVHDANGGKDRDILRSPLAKRKKLAADRSGYSKLKEAITAEELQDFAAESGSRRGTPLGGPKDVQVEEEEESDGEDEEDDFLARELEEEWG